MTISRLNEDVWDVYIYILLAVIFPSSYLHWASSDNFICHYL